MSENKHFAVLRGKVATASTNEVLDGERSSKAKTSTSRPQLKKKSYWTNSSLATKTRRLSRKHKTPLTGSSATRKENENQQTKTSQSFEKNLEDYTSWCDHYLLRGLHREISPDLRTAIGDGVTLVNLVESLTCKSVHGISRQPMTWSQKLENIHLCFHFLKSEGVVLHGISPEDIIEGQLTGILSLFNRLETHFECVRYPTRRQEQAGEKIVNKTYPPNSPPDHGRNGRVSSGYHTEEDGYNDGRTTPIIDVLPGLLTGSETESDEETRDVIETSDIRLHHDGKLGASFEGSPSDKFTPISMNHRGHHHSPQRSHSAFNEYRSPKNASILDHIGYMPSHPSTKTRTSPNKLHYDDNSDRSSSLEKSNSLANTIVKTSYINNTDPSHSILVHPGDNDRHINIGARDNFGLEFTAADFGIDDSTSFERGSNSSTGTPVLPDLSSASSFEDLPLDFSSDTSGFTRENFTTSTQLHQDTLYQKGISNNNMDIQKQVEALRVMYQKLLVLVNKENQRKPKWSSPKMSALQAQSTGKQRTKDMKSVNRRFARVESHVVTLARSVDHLRSETRTQADTSRQLDELREDVKDFKDSVYSNNFHAKHMQRSRGHEVRVHRLQKLKRFFGVEPPMVAILLQRMGYERFIPHFKAEDIGILELSYMTEQRLQNLGIPLGPRLRILEEIQKLR